MLSLLVWPKVNTLNNFYSKIANSAILYFLIIFKFLPTNFIKIIFLSSNDYFFVSQYGKVHKLIFLNFSPNEFCFWIIMGQGCSQNRPDKVVNVRYTTEFEWTIPNWRRVISSSTQAVLHGNLDQTFPELNSKTFIIPGSRKGVNHSFIVYAAPKIVTRTKGIENCITLV